ncbi:magnesium transporter [Desulforamulus ferrireducens]|uniref:Magnesium transporter MgtE n=1 Tax=Desulforamulus ferrireducens TaxID=1833852 RepID=A0A1S6IYN6_9FIRM|nr:magnesium transporter [Desulforamulus ferrireducens]AQS59894.1 magnesium transporter [Desulforamulus ferrireducens]
MAIKDCINQLNETKLRHCLADLHPADVAEVLPEVSLAQRVRVLRAAGPERAALILYELDRDMVPPLLEALGPIRLAKVLNAMSDDDAADILGELPESQKDQLLSLMEEAEAADVRELLKYGKDTAGGIMTTEYVSLKEDMTVAEALASLRKLGPEVETIYYVYAINEHAQLTGAISLRELILAPPEARIKQVANRRVITAHVWDDQEKVAKLVAKYDFIAIPVVNDENQLLGIVTVDDILDVLEEEATEDILKLANVDAEGQDFVESSPWQRAIRRLPWLIGLLFGGLIAGNVIKEFSGTLEKVTALAFFITAMAGGPGNAATQSLALVVRGLATGEVDQRRLLKAVGKEAQVGIIVGLVSGSVLALVAYLWQGTTSLGLVVGLALAINITIATILGSFFPVIIHRLGADPAVASGPFISTLMDVTSMFIYFSLAAWLL